MKELKSSSDSGEFNKPDVKVDKKPPRWNWRSVVRTMRDVSSVASVIISLVKILEELGLLP